MSVAPGTRLGPYEVVAPLGAGGMGEVYRARDTRLGRDVAIKVLPHHLSSNPEVRARFEREAKTVSALNHPNICTLHDVGREGGTDYLVMELVDGETLAQRLTHGPLPVPEVLKLGAQIADALDRAHRAGVIHRDLKPGNVMVTKIGVKLMDFGLARATGLAGPAGGATVLAMTQSPTMAAPLTAEGTIVGTFQYMSPEQLEGKESDARSDLWALGCVLYEMTTGKRAFEGASQASLIGAIMHTQPASMTALAPMSPPALERVVKQCLAKDPDERWQSAGDVRRELEWIATGSTSISGVAAAAGASAPKRAAAARVAWSVAAVLGVALAALAITTLRAPRDTATSMHVAITPPEGATVIDDASNAFVSPDGRAVVFLATDSTSVSQLWLRELSEPDAHPLPGTQQGTLPFWSPDSRFIGFFADGKLKKVDRAGRNAQILCDAPDGRGGAWSPRGVIVFAPVSNGPLMQVSDAGGNASVLLTPDSTRTERGMRFPQFLPDGDHFLYLTLSTDSLATRMGSLSSRDTRWIITGEAKAVYAPPGFLLYMRSGAILAQRFDRGSGRRSGRPQVVAAAAEGGQYTGFPTFSVSDNGVLVQRHRTSGSRQFAWLNREGQRLGVVPAPAADYGFAELSPDDRSVAVCIVASSDGSADVWTVDLSRGLTTRLTSDFPFCERPIWSPDSKWVIFSTLAREGRMLVRRLASGAGPADTVWAGRTPFSQPTSYAPDGRSIVIRDLDPRTGEDIWILPTDGSRQPRPLLVSAAHEEDGIVSPDSRWLAFRSTESGRSELYIQSYPVADAKLRVSTDGAGQPRSPLGRAFWRRDGRELVYVGGDGVTVMSAAFDPKGGPHVSTPLPLFRIPSGCQELAATSDLKRFLILEDRATKESASIHMTLGWPAELRQERSP